MSSSQSTAATACSHRRRRWSASSKAEFVRVVTAAINRLESQHGYGRERATRAVLQEIAAISANAAAAPRDEQVFTVMQKNGISWEQAVRALFVAHAVDEAGLTAITERLKKASLLEHGAADDFLAIEQPRGNTGIRPPVCVNSNTSKNSAKPPTVKAVGRKINKESVAHRRRPLEASSSVTQQRPDGNRKPPKTTASRRSERDDAVTEKLALNPDDATVARTANMTTSAVGDRKPSPRKRGRSTVASEESDNCCSNNKRVRGAGTAAP